MKDAMGGAVLGGTKWKKFALVMVPAVGVAGAMVVATAQGALATSINISGSQFQVAAGHLKGTTFQQTGGVIVDKQGHPHAVAIAGIAHAEITNLCQSVKVPIPGIGSLVVVLKAGGGGTPASADNLVLSTDSIKGDAVFKSNNDDDPGVKIGVDASDLTAVKGFHGTLGAFGQVVDQADLDNVQQTAYSTTATTFTLKGMSIDANFNGASCF